MILCFDIGGTAIKTAEAFHLDDIRPKGRVPTPARDFAAFTAARIDQQVHLSVDNIALNSPVLRGVIPGGVIMLSPGGYEANGHTTAAIVSRLEAAGIVTVSD